MAPDRPVSRPYGSGSASRPAAPFPIGWLPSLTSPDRPVARLRCSGSPGCPDSPAPRAARRCQAPAINTGFPAFPASRGDPGVVLVSCGESIFTPSSPVTQEIAEIHFKFFPRPHVLHRITSVIRISERFSTALCTTHPQVAWRNFENTCTRSPNVITQFFSATFGCPHRGSGCQVRANSTGRRPLRGKSPRAVFICARTN